MRNRPFVPPVPVFPLFLDLPLLTGDEVPHAPHVAVTARPWPGSAAVYSADSDDDYALNLLLQAAGGAGGGAGGFRRRAGRAVTTGRNVLRVRLTQGALASVERA